MYQQWCKIVQRDKKNKQLRTGQIFMHSLCIVDIDLYVAISCTELDCFYDDSKCTAFKNHIFDCWENKK